MCEADRRRRGLDQEGNLLLSFTSSQGILQKDLGNFSLVATHARRSDEEDNCSLRTLSRDQEEDEEGNVVPSSLQSSAFKKVFCKDFFSSTK